MITKITGEQPFQVLTNNFSISPSNEGYTLQISADGKEYSNLFSVGAGVTRLVTGVAANSYYRLLGNQSEVKVNWMKTCVTEGGGGAAGNELTPLTEFPLDAAEGTVVAYAGSSSATGVYQYDGTDWIPVGGSDMRAYWTSAQTKDYVDSGDTATYAAASAYTDEAIAEALAPYWDSAATKDYVDSADTAILAEVGELSGVVQEQQIVFSSGYNELHTQVMELSGRTVDLSSYYTSGETDAAISAATAGKADAANVSANTGGLKFPLWNTQGIITGLASSNTYAMAGFEVNGTNYSIIKYGNKAIPGVYAPITSGETGQILTPSGNTPVWITPATINGSAITDGGNIVIQGGGDMSDYWTSAQTKNYVDNELNPLSNNLQVLTWDVGAFSGYVETMDTVVSAALVDLNTRKVESTSVHTIWKGTQAEYDLIITKDPDTLYIIVNNN